VIHVPIRGRTGAIAEAVRRLDAADVGLDDIALRRPTLDDGVITLTGHAAEEPESEEVPA
jgi:ABC-2 type transport system ATP-binding protein